MAIKNRTWKFGVGTNEAKTVVTKKKSAEVKKVTTGSGSTTGLSTSKVKRR